MDDQTILIIVVVIIVFIILIISSKKSYYSSSSFPDNIPQLDQNPPKKPWNNEHVIINYKDGSQEHTMYKPDGNLHYKYVEFGQKVCVGI